MSIKYLLLLSALFLSFHSNAQNCFTCDNVPEGTIFCDDFESGEPLKDRYFEYGNNGGKFIPMEGVGRDGSIGMRVLWDKGQVGAGGFKKSFGRTPVGYIGRHAVNPKEEYNEIYWRIDIRRQAGWQGGGGAKLSRATTMVNNNWAQGMIAHIWSAGENSDYLGMDPASGISRSGKLVSTKYNDFNNLRWLGFKKGDIPLFSEENSDKWFCVVAHAKLNTPGKKDGIFEFWINDSLQAGTYDLNWHGTWNSDPKNMYINAIFIENYWNSGSPIQQERYMDNFVISTKPIPCKCATITASEKPSSTNSVQIYPNPASQTIYIKVDRDIALRGYVFELMDVYGRVVHRTGLLKQLRSSIDIGTEYSGMYYYRITSDNKVIQQASLLMVK